VPLIVKSVELNEEPSSFIKEHDVIGQVPSV
jgi:hypothetical protein